MRFHPFVRTVLCQGIALIAFLAFLTAMDRHAPDPSGQVSRLAQAAGAAVFVSLADDQRKPEPDAPEQTAVARDAAADARRKPERFRPSAQAVDGDPTRGELPALLPDRDFGAETVAVPPRDLPLSYLMKFRNMAEFHAFLDDLPDVGADESTMSLVRVEGLPRTAAELRRLFASYRMEPFLFNPQRFNYLVTSHLDLLTDQSAIRDYVASVGRYMKEDGPNPAYAAIRDEFVSRARTESAIQRTITDEGEYRRMQLGLASIHLSRFLRRLEEDTARQLTELTGRPISVRDIARVDCRFRDVNGAMVLVPWRAYLGSDPSRRPIAIWEGA